LWSARTEGGFVSEEYIVVNSGAREYFCNACGQLRLSLSRPTACGNCGSFDIIIGEINALDGNKLKADWQKRRDEDLFADGDHDQGAQ
jgi:hypothetical protein